MLSRRALWLAVSRAGPIIQLMNRQTRKRITSRVSNFIWSLAIFILLIIFGLYAFEHWVLPWFGAMGDTI